MERTFSPEQRRLRDDAHHHLARRTRRVARVPPATRHASVLPRHLVRSCVSRAVRRRREPRPRGSFRRPSPLLDVRAVTTVDDPSFTLEAYAVHPWYVQQQMIVRYQPEDTLYCVRASYTLEPDGSVSVLNTANRGAVGGPRQNPTLTRLRAVVADPQSDVPPSSSSSALVSSPGSRTGPTGSSPRPRSSPTSWRPRGEKATTGPSCRRSTQHTGRHAGDVRHRNGDERLGAVDLRARPRGEPGDRRRREGGGSVERVRPLGAQGRRARGVRVPGRNVTRAAI